MTEAPLIVQQDRTVLLETQHPGYEMARDRLQRFAELEKSPEYVHFYKITAVSVWNAAALGETLASIVDWLILNSRFPIARPVLAQLTEWHRRYGLLQLESAKDGSGELVLTPRRTCLPNLRPTTNCRSWLHTIAMAPCGYSKQTGGRSSRCLCAWAIQSTTARAT